MGKHLEIDFFIHFMVLGIGNMCASMKDFVISPQLLDLERFKPQNLAYKKGLLKPITLEITIRKTSFLNKDQKVELAVRLFTD